MHAARGLAVALVIVALTGCDVALIPTYTPSSPAVIRSVDLTSEATDHIEVQAGGGSLVATAPNTNLESNIRTVFWPTGSPAVADSQSCATWTSETGGDIQPGVAFRIRVGATGRVRAITITRNVSYGIHSAFNFHTWDTDRPVNPFELFGQVSIPAIANGLASLPLPWHFCGRISGTTVEFKVWPDSVSEPAWGNTTWGGKATVPAGWTASGPTGWYLGHLAAGNTARFDDLRTWRAS